MTAAYRDFIARATGLLPEDLPNDYKAHIAATQAAIAMALRGDAVMRKPLSALDASRLQRLLPVVYARMQDRTWKVGDLTAGLAPYEDKNRPLFRALGDIDGNVGKFLVRCAGHGSDSLRLERLPQKGHQYLWRVRPVGTKPP